MSAIAGQAGSAKITASNTIVQVESWSLDIDGGLVDSHSLGDSWAESTQTVKRWTATLNVRWAIPDDANGQAAIQTDLLAGDTLTDLRLYTNASNYYSGNAKIASMTIDTPVDDLVTATFECTGEGALSYT